MEITQLKQFKAVATTQNMSVAANDILYISQPALSISIQKFEEELGVKLFDRDGKKIKLNEAGKIVLNHVNVILDEIDHINSDMQRYASTESKCLKIASVGITMLRHFQICYTQDNDALQIQGNILAENQIKASLLNASCDIGFSSEPIKDEQIDSMLLCTYRTLITVPDRHPFAKLKSVSLNQLESQTFLGYVSYVEDPAITNIYALLKKNNIHIERVIMPSDDVLFNEVLKTSKYLSFMNSIAQKDSACPNNRKLVPISDKETILSYYMNYLKKSNPKVDQVRNWLRNNYLNFMVDKPI